MNSTRVSPFRIDVVDSGGVVQGDGPLINLLNLNSSELLDQIGSISFFVSAADPRYALIGPASWYRVWDEVDGYLGQFRHGETRLSDMQGQTGVIITAYDSLVDLTGGNVGYHRSYENESAANIIEEIIDPLSDWATDIEPGLGNASVTFEGDSPFLAIDVLRKLNGSHFRLLSADPSLKTLEMGFFGDSSGITVLGLKGQEQSRFLQNPNIAIVEQISLVSESRNIYNTIVALGAGQGVGQLTMGGIQGEGAADLGSYTLESFVNKDGSTSYYIQDSASVTSYGERWRTIANDKLRPITNSEENIKNAANTLKLAAEAFLENSKDPVVVYSLNVKGIRKDLRVGQTIHLQFRGAVDGYKYIDVDENFYVLGINTQRASNGQRSISLEISNKQERVRSDEEVLVEMYHNISAFQVHVPITLAYSPIGPYVKRISGAVEAEYTIRIGDEVTALNYAKLHLKSSPLKSSISSMEASTDHRHMMFELREGEEVTVIGAIPLYNVQDALTGGTALHVGVAAIDSDPPEHDLFTNSADGSHTHEITYGVFSDTSYPDSVSIMIDGVDVTDDLDGPWGAIDGGFDVELDITDYLLGASGGLRQNHSVVLTCVSGQGEIEFECDMLVSIQAIVIG